MYPKFRNIGEVASLFLFLRACLPSIPLFYFHFFPCCLLLTTFVPCVSPSFLLSVFLSFLPLFFNSFLFYCFVHFVILLFLHSFLIIFFLPYLFFLHFFFKFRVLFTFPLLSVSFLFISQFVAYFVFLPFAICSAFIPN